MKPSDGRELWCHSTKRLTYFSIFGKIEIGRAYYWREGEERFCPLDAGLTHHAVPGKIMAADVAGIASLAR